MINRIIVNAILQVFIKPLWSDSPTVEKVRRRFSLLDRISNFGRAATPLRTEQVEHIDLEWFGSDVNKDQGVILYLHGGAFCVRAPLADRRFCKDISQRTGLPVVMVAYRLSPEFPYPAGLDDCYHIFLWLQEHGILANRIVLLGHSAGANLALSMLIRTRKNGLQQPAGAILLSAPVDLSVSELITETNARSDVMFTTDIWPWVIQSYLLNTSTENSEVSPILDKWNGFPPLHFHVSDSELLLDNSLRAVQHAAGCGVEVQLTRWPGMPHSFPFIEALSNAKRCKVEISQFVAKLLSTSYPINQKAVQKV